MARTKQIYMNEPLRSIEEEAKGAGWSFSARLGEIVERYNIIMDMEQLPDFSEGEIMILSEVICGGAIDRRKVRGLHLDVLDASTGAREAREALSAKVAAMTAGQRLKLIEDMGRNDS